MVDTNLHLVLFCPGHWSWQSNTRPMWTLCWPTGRSSFRNLAGKRPIRDSCSMLKGLVREASLWRINWLIQRLHWDVVCFYCFPQVISFLITAYTLWVPPAKKRLTLREHILHVILAFPCCPLKRACGTKSKMEESLEFFAINWSITEMLLAAKKLLSVIRIRRVKSVKTGHTFQASSLIPALSCNAINLAALCFQSNTDRSKIKYHI